MNPITIGSRRIAPGEPTFIIAELSANHGQDFDRAVRILEAAAAAGADAVKLQTYTPDTMTIDSSRPEFVISGTLWQGRTLYELYGEAYTPWEWQPRLKLAAESLGMELFSTPFDSSSVAFLESMDVPAYKIASFENVDLPLLRRVAVTGRPVIMSTGMATFDEIQEAVTTLRQAGCQELILLKCTSAYPAPASEMNLRTIPHLSTEFDVPVGLSDHTLDLVVPVVGVTVGAVAIEKHLTLSRADAGPDSAFSLEPDEFAAMVRAVRTAEQALGEVRYGANDEERASRAFRRSLFVVENVPAGSVLNADNVRAIRPGHGMHTRFLEQVIGCRATVDIARGTPLAWDLIDRAMP